MKIYVLLFFACCATQSWCASYQETTTQYGTFVLSEPTTSAILERITEATHCEFSELPVPDILNDREQRMFKAYISSENPTEQLSQLAAEAQVNNWHKAYINAIKQLFQMAKRMQH